MYVMAVYCMLGRCSESPPTQHDLTTNLPRTCQERAKNATVEFESCLSVPNEL